MFKAKGNICSSTAARKMNENRCAGVEFLLGDTRRSEATYFTRNVPPGGIFKARGNICSSTAARNTDENRCED